MAAAEAAGAGVAAVGDGVGSGVLDGCGVAAGREAGAVTAAGGAGGGDKGDGDGDGDGDVAGGGDTIVGCIDSAGEVATASGICLGGGVGVALATIAGVARGVGVGFFGSGFGAAAVLAARLRASSVARALSSPGCSVQTTGKSRMGFQSNCRWSVLDPKPLPSRHDRHCA